MKQPLSLFHHKVDSRNGRTTTKKALLVLGILPLFVPPLAAQFLWIHFEDLSGGQKSLFTTYPPCQGQQPDQIWYAILDLSQRLEFAGGTQALETFQINTDPKTNSLSFVKSISNILGNSPNAPSEKQFNVEVGWAPGADKKFAALKGWRPHIAWLHPGQFGYGENRNGNPFLGVVVLFDKDHTATGQLHIGFKWGPAHYEPDNGNIRENYDKYKKWYGEIHGYSP